MQIQCVYSTRNTHKKCSLKKITMQIIRELFNEWRKDADQKNTIFYLKVLRRFWLWCLTPRHFQKYFSYTVVVNFLGEANRTVRRKPPTCRVSLNKPNHIILYRAHLAISGLGADSILSYKSKYHHDGPSWTIFGLLGNFPKNPLQISHWHSQIGKCKWSAFWY